MSLPIHIPYAPMEAQSMERLPEGAGWQYEPKWDGFRCLAFRDGDEIELQSKSGQPLGRYFPELLATLRALPARRFVLDGEIVIPVEGRLSFDELLLRIHPAESRVRKLAMEHPATYILFDLLVDAGGRSWAGRSLRERRAALETFAQQHVPGKGDLRLSPATADLATAREWLGRSGSALDGVVAKRCDCPYRSGERDGMQKVKRVRSAECVVGGFRYASSGGVVGSLLLGLYNAEGKLDHVGFCSSLTAAERTALTPKLEALILPPGFTGKRPGGPSRWSTRRTDEWEPLRPELVVEVTFDHFNGGRFRHGTGFMRWRPDKAPRQCTYEQVRGAESKSLELLRAETEDPVSGPERLLAA